MIGQVRDMVCVCALAWLMLVLEPSHPSPGVLALVAAHLLVLFAIRTVWKLNIVVLGVAALAIEEKGGRIPDVVVRRQALAAGGCFVLSVTTAVLVSGRMLQWMLS